MMRAAMRRRPTSQTTEVAKDKQPASEATVKQVANEKRDEKIVKAVVETQADPERIEVDSAPGDQAELAILPIAQRRPDEAYSTEQRRARAFENVGKVSKALQQYYRKNKIYPRSYSTTSSGIAALSWRVEILPFLGYQDLYDRFDQSRPWNKEPNQSLLQYIPDEFVSPERFDSSTNYLLPAHRLFMFADNKRRADHNVEDGIENTIMLLEVNDKLAVPWTKPSDYVPADVHRLSNDLGDLRKNGTFAVWGNGSTVLLANELTNRQLLNCLTYESGDGQLAGVIHRDIAIEGISEASVAAVPDADGPKITQEKRPPVVTMPIDTGSIRQQVPKAAEITKAQKKLRVIFADRMKVATKDDETSKLATEMLAEAANIQDDWPGVYALQSAAMRLAVDSGSSTVLIRAIDQRVGTFEVDAYEENTVGLLAFGKAALSRDPETIEGSELIDRAVRVIYAGIADDDFLRASAIARIAFRYTEESRRELIPKLLNRLRLLLSTANREYDSVKGDLQRYRNDPSDHEAGAAVGRFLCFIKGDWHKGLPLLVAGGPLQLRELAQLDLRGAKTRFDRVSLGDAWWDISERARAGVYRQAARDRAVYWYQQAYDSLPDSLDRMHVKSRMDEADETDGTSPIALCVQLADELGVSLEVGLAGISTVGLRRPRHQGPDRDRD